MRLQCQEDEEKDTIQEQIQEIQTGNTNLDALRGLLNRANDESPLRVGNSQ